MVEEKIIKLLAARDQEGLNLLIENYSGILYSIIKKVLIKFPYLQDEVLNDALLGVWENINSFDPTRSSFKNWLASVARYMAIDALRREVRHNYQTLDESYQEGQEDGFNKVLIKEIFTYLDEDDRKLFTALFLEGYSYEELAQDLKASKDSLYGRVKRAREKLKEEFN